MNQDNSSNNNNSHDFVGLVNHTSDSIASNTTDTVIYWNDQRNFLQNLFANTLLSDDFNKDTDFNCLGLDNLQLNYDTEGSSGTSETTNGQATTSRLTNQPTLNQQIDTFNNQNLASSLSLISSQLETISNETNVNDNLVVSTSITSPSTTTTTTTATTSTAATVENTNLTSSTNNRSSQILIHHSPFDLNTVDLASSNNLTAIEPSQLLIKECNKDFGIDHCQHHTTNLQDTDLTNFEKSLLQSQQQQASQTNLRVNSTNTHNLINESTSNNSQTPQIEKSIENSIIPTITLLINDLNQDEDNLLFKKPSTPNYFSETNTNNLQHVTYFNSSSNNQNYSTLEQEIETSSSSTSSSTNSSNSSSSSSSSNSNDSKSLKQKSDLISNLNKEEINKCVIKLVELKQNTTTKTNKESKNSSTPITLVTLIEPKKDNLKSNLININSVGNSETEPSCSSSSSSSTSSSSNSKPNSTTTTTASTNTTNNGCFSTCPTTSTINKLFTLKRSRKRSKLLNIGSSASSTSSNCKISSSVCLSNKSKNLANTHSNNCNCSSNRSDSDLVQKSFNIKQSKLLNISGLTKSTNTGVGGSTSGNKKEKKEKAKQIKINSATNTATTTTTAAAAASASSIVNFSSNLEPLSKKFAVDSDLSQTKTNDSLSLTSTGTNTPSSSNTETISTILKNNLIQNGSGSGNSCNNTSQKPKKDEVELHIKELSLLDLHSSEDDSNADIIRNVLNGKIRKNVRSSSNDHLINLTTSVTSFPSTSNSATSSNNSKNNNIYLNEIISKRIKYSPVAISSSSTSNQQVISTSSSSSLSSGQHSTNLSITNKREDDQLSFNLTKLIRLNTKDNINLFYINEPPPPSTESNLNTETIKGETQQKEHRIDKLIQCLTKSSLDSSCVNSRNLDESNQQHQHQHLHKKPNVNESKSISSISLIGQIANTNLNDLSLNQTNNSQNKRKKNDNNQLNQTAASMVGSSLASISSSCHSCSLSLTSQSEQSLELNNLSNLISTQQQQQHHQQQQHQQQQQQFQHHQSGPSLDSTKSLSLDNDTLQHMRNLDLNNDLSLSSFNEYSTSGDSIGSSLPSIKSSNEIFSKHSNIQSLSNINQQKQIHSTRSTNSLISTTTSSTPTTSHNKSEQSLHLPIDLNDSDSRKALWSLLKKHSSIDEIIDQFGSTLHDKISFWDLVQLKLKYSQTSQFKTTYEIIDDYTILYSNMSALLESFVKEHSSYGNMSNTNTNKKNENSSRSRSSSRSCRKPSTTSSCNKI